MSLFDDKVSLKLAFPMDQIFYITSQTIAAEDGDQALIRQAA